MRLKQCGEWDTACAMIKLLYEYPFARAYSFSFLLGVLWFTFIAAMTENIYDNAFYGAAFIGIISPLLCFVFLLKLPQGRWWQKLAFEICVLFAGMALVCLLNLYIYCLIVASLHESIVVETFYSSLALSFFSHLAVRIFARPYQFWLSIRNKRLVWEITHAQLRFILLGVVLLFIAVVLFTHISMLNFYPTVTYTWFVNAVSLTILYAGSFGIITGILLLVLIFPAIAISYFTARRITHRLEQLILSSNAIRGGDYSNRVKIEGEDEVAKLQANFNAMAEELESSLTQLKSERDAVASLLESRRRLFANISHELRTPIATIRLLLEQAQKEQNSDKLALIEADILRLQRLIDDVFVLVQADNRQLIYKLEAQNPMPILEELLSGVRQQAWQSKKVDISLECAAPVPNVMLDKERLEQIVLNLLRNAVRHTPPGGFVVLRVNPKSSTVEFEVCDTGAGIAEADLPYIWERFYRGEQSRLAETQGLGLGLALVKEMLEAMNGSISVDSSPNIGTCFRFSLPHCDNFATIA
jgi:signal transduction histidine kinase